MKKNIFTKLAPALALALVATTTFAHAEALKVGGKGFTEQLLLAEITSQLLISKGHEVVTKKGMGTSLLRKALENNQIDLYWEYTGTAFLVFHKNKFSSQTGEEIYQAVKAEDAKKGLIWLNKSAANNTYALAVRREYSEKNNLKTLNDLAKSVNNKSGLIFGCNVEFYKREDGLKPLQEAYGFKFARSNVKRMDSGLVYKALKDSQVDVGLVFATDGRIPAFDFVVLEDTKNFFPSYAITPVVRKAVLDANPSLAEDLNELSALLNDKVMASLNAQVDVDKKSVREVATKFLKQKELI